MQRGANPAFPCCPATALAPPAAIVIRLLRPGDGGGDHRHDDGHFLSRRVSMQNLDFGAGPHALRLLRLAAHSGMFPCFFGGSVSRLERSARSAFMTYVRVCEGSITEST